MCHKRLSDGGVNPGTGTPRLNSRLLDTRMGLYWELGWGRSGVDILFQSLEVIFPTPKTRYDRSLVELLPSVTGPPLVVTGRSPVPCAVLLVGLRRTVKTYNRRPTSVPE